MTNTQLGLFRHGQTDWNVNFLLQGITDIPMNEAGIAQVIEATDALNSKDWDLLLTSPLGRARHTAEIISGAIGLDLIVDELLLERSFGEAEGLSYEIWKEKYSSMESIPGVESKFALQSRALTFLERLERDYAGQRVLAVSHGAFIRSVIGIASLDQLPKDGERLANASLNHFHHRNQSWELVSYSLEPLKIRNNI